MSNKVSSFDDIVTNTEMNCCGRVILQKMTSVIIPPWLKEQINSKDETTEDNEKENM